MRARTARAKRAEPRVTVVDLERFFDTQIRGRDDHLWTTVESKSVEWVDISHAHAEARAWLETPTLIHQTYSHQDLLAQQLSTVVQEFSSNAVLARVHELEQAVLALQQVLTQVKPGPVLAKPSFASELASVFERIDALSGAFGEAFGDNRVAVTACLIDDEEYAIRVTVNASAADGPIIDAARANGARTLFYHRALEILPTELFDLIDFEFVFPTNDT